MNKAMEEYIKDMNTLNPNYKAIIVLDCKLTEKKIPHELLRLMDIDTALSHFERVHKSYNACIDELLKGEEG